MNGVNNKFFLNLLQDFLDMSGTEEDQKLLMKNCKINCKEEKDKVEAEASVVTTAKAGVNKTLFLNSLTK